MENRGIKLKLFGLFLGVMLVVGVFFASKAYIFDKTEIYTNYLGIAKSNVFLVYGNKVSLMINEETYLTKDKQLKDYLDAEKYDELLEIINDIFPKDVEGYAILDKDWQSEVPKKHRIIVPTYNRTEKDYLLLSEINKIFLNIYYGEELKKDRVENVLVDILNGNGITGSAGKAGEKLKRKFGYDYTAANYEEDTQFSYIINNGMGEEQLKELVLTIDQNYVRVKEKGSLPTASNVVLILGKEQRDLVNIYVLRKSYYDSDNFNKLKDSGFVTVKRDTTTKSFTQTYIEYNKKDYFIAYKVAKVLGINILKQNNKLEDEINVYIK